MITDTKKNNTKSKSATAQKSGRPDLAAGAANIHRLEKATSEPSKAASPKEKANTAPTKIGSMLVHRAAKLFNILPAKEMKELKADIEANGIKCPVLLNKERDTILDGRNRWLVALDLGWKEQDIPIETFEGKDEDIPNEILSRNVFRRHLSDDQRLALITKLRAPQLEAEAQARMKAGKADRSNEVILISSEGGDMRQHIAREAKVSEHKAQQALNARKAGLLDDVFVGDLSLNKASKKVRTKKRARKEVPLDDQVWKEYAKLLRHFGIELERKVKQILRSFLEPKPAKTHL